MQPARTLQMHSEALVPLRLGVASANPAKVAAVRRLMRRLRVPHRLLAQAVASGVSEQPCTEEETIRGAMHRTAALLDATDVDAAIAFEGGVDRTLFGTFACEWCVVRDRSGSVGIGGGAKILLPQELADRVLRGESLATATSRWGHQVSQRDGVFGLLTHGVLTRERVNTDILVLALSRFLNAPLYADASGALASTLGELLLDRIVRRHRPPQDEQLSLCLQ